jgi:calcineurin-like phosphoesterase family protein
VPQLTLAIITDIHHGPDRGTKLGTTALPLLARFRDFVADLRPECTVEMGDRISDVDEATDRKLVAEVAACLSKFPGPIHHIVGNHDVAKLTVEDNEELMQHSFASHSNDVNGFHLVFWNANDKLDHAKGFSLAPGDLDWLRADLAATELPSVIFTHVPLDNGSMKGNFYFEKAWAHHGAYPETEGEAIRDVIERSGKVILCVNGHAHWNAYHGIDGTHYVTIPSLTESFTTWPHPNEAFASLRIGETIEIEVFGRTPLLYRLPIKAKGEHWVNIHKDYAPSTVQPA